MLRRRFLHLVAGASAVPLALWLKAQLPPARRPAPPSASAGFALLSAHADAPTPTPCPPGAPGGWSIPWSIAADCGTIDWPAQTPTPAPPPTSTPSPTPTTTPQPWYRLWLPFVRR